MTSGVRLCCPTTSVLSKINLLTSSSDWRPVCLNLLAKKRRHRACARLRIRANMPAAHSQSDRDREFCSAAVVSAVLMKCSSSEEEKESIIWWKLRSEGVPRSQRSPRLFPHEQKNNDGPSRHDRLPRKNMDPENFCSVSAERGLNFVQR